MKKTMGAMFALVLGAVGFVQTAQATPTGLTKIGLGDIFPANFADPSVLLGDAVHITATEALLTVGAGGPPPTVVWLGRYSTADGGVVDPVLGALGADYTVSGTTDSGGKSGTWSIDLGAYNFESVIVEINGGNTFGFATPILYSVNDPTLNSGYWDLSDFGRRTAFDFVDIYGIYLGPNDVPEPMSLALVGGGIAGMGFLRRKKRS